MGGNPISGLPQTQSLLLRIRVCCCQSVSCRNVVMVTWYKTCFCTRCWDLGGKPCLGKLPIGFPPVIKLTPKLEEGNQGVYCIVFDIVLTSNGTWCWIHLWSMSFPTNIVKIMRNIHALHVLWSGGTLVHTTLSLYLLSRQWIFYTIAWRKLCLQLRWCLIA
jgi:hypothetical protein